MSFLSYLNCSKNHLQSWIHIRSDSLYILWS
jgi:hypothetical protein